MTNISTQKERILHFLEFKGISKNKFYIKTGISNGVLDKKSGLSMDTVEKFYSTYEEVNAEWLLTGKGDMLKPNIKEMPPLERVAKRVAFSEETKNTENATVSLNEPQHEYGIPLIPIEAMGGFGNGSVQVMDYDTQKYIVPEFTELKVDFMIRVKGSSMYPKYNSGDLVACKKLVLSDIFFQWNKVYVLDTDQGALIKRIKKGSDDHLLIVSDNKSYEPYELHLSKIHAIAIVLGVIRLE
ncbi:Phage repressor protein C, contains Cro/C1-type HTH and peptisase s24 domains [Flavobacterium fluvii]|uniref:Phage repressor protein C, contains Cro/C1-type HTH and peptisase s24 domains n=1 Tax=Flavobacterium fluvii TaxID=468056 RepID=A0A1M5JB21_9FLAO|nr:S24 family peptidase [Flavobacterium fluvii]SHG37565.1 Phage repressor protein C, contains Cro/C1-type HTH and peptisase s24 domains [Flavobacterium fluvii]